MEMRREVKTERRGVINAERNKGEMGDEKKERLKLREEA